MNLARAVFLGTTFGASAFLAGCQTTGTAGGTATTPLPGGGSASITFTVGFNGSKSADVVATPPICAKFCFLDSEGASLGCTTIETPGTAQVPDGAVGFSASLVPCSKQPADNGGLGGAPYAPGALANTQVPGVQIGGNPQRRVAGPYPNTIWTLFGGNVVPIADGSTNVSYTFNVKAKGLSQAEKRRDMVLAGGIGTPVGASFDVIYYNESYSEFDVTGFPTGVRMRQAEVNDDFTTYRLTVNNNVFAELGSTGNLLHYGASNQWSVIETFVPISAFNSNPLSFDNQADVDWTSANSNIAWQASQHVFAN